MIKCKWCKNEINPDYDYKDICIKCYRLIQRLRVDIKLSKRLIKAIEKGNM